MTSPAPVRALFLQRGERDEQRRDFGLISMLSGPAAGGSSALTAMEVRLEPGTGHAFHRHPLQDELIYIADGEVEQWLDRERRVLRGGDAVYIPRGVVHGTKNVGARTAVTLAILGPSAGADGYAVEDLFDREPWKSLLAGVDGRREA